MRWRLCYILMWCDRNRCGRVGGVNSPEQTPMPVATAATAATALCGSVCGCGVSEPVVPQTWVGGVWAAGIKLPAAPPLIVSLRWSSAVARLSFSVFRLNWKGKCWHFFWWSFSLPSIFFCFLFILPHHLYALLDERTWSCDAVGFEFPVLIDWFYLRISWLHFCLIVRVHRHSWNRITAHGGGP